VDNRFLKVDENSPDRRLAAVMLALSTSGAVVVVKWSRSKTERRFTMTKSAVALSATGPKKVNICCPVD
jgi:uncharacterized membrane protein YphA (DoxX/SURF4 family)